MLKKILYHTSEKIVEYNLLALTLFDVKKADKSELRSKAKLIEVIEGCKKTKGDVYDKATFLFKGLIQKHAFASGNRRTAFIVTKDFILINKGKFLIKNDPKQAKIMTGIREGFYTDKEIKEWIKNGEIKQFKR